MTISDKTRRRAGILGPLARADDMVTVVEHHHEMGDRTAVARALSELHDLLGLVRAAAMEALDES